MLKTKQKIALANLVQTVVMVVRRLVGKGSEAKVRRSDVERDLDLREGVDFSIWLLGSFEPETVRCYQKIVKAGDILLDIGANIGAHALLLAQAVGAVFLCRACTHCGRNRDCATDNDTCRGHRHGRSWGNGNIQAHAVSEKPCLMDRKSFE